MKTLLAGMFALFTFSAAETPAPELAPQDAAGKTFTFSPAQEQQTTARATAKGDIPYPASASSHTPKPITVPAEKSSRRTISYTKTGPATACINCKHGTTFFLTFETPDSGTCVLSESMPGATRTYRGIRFSMR